MSKIELPDMNQMMDLINSIKNLSLEKMVVEIEIDKDVSSIIKNVTTKPEYYVNGKPASMSYIEKTYAFTGLNGELIEKREKLAGKESDLEHARLLLKAYQDMIEIWRTQSANERASVNA